METWPRPGWDVRPAYTPQQESPCNGIVRGLLAETYSQCIGDGPSYGLRPGASALSNLVRYWVSTDLNALAGIKPLN
jgi:hypothetical protein